MVCDGVCVMVCDGVMVCVCGGVCVCVCCVWTKHKHDSVWVDSPV